MRSLSPTSTRWRLGREIPASFHSISRWTDSAARSRQFERYSNYIKMRLKQIAYERKYGIYEAYARVLVRERPEIQFATQLLLDKPS